MKDATKDILNELSVRGYRITQARTEVIASLSALQQPQSIQSICARVKSSNEASVYRTVRMLVTEGFAEEIAVQNSVSHYALSHGHHHHAVCTGCGFMEHLECSTEKLELPRSFQAINSHEVTLYGLCKKCV
jgi:Fe2+ or Zn2+ uptake regulation protein